MGGRVVQGTGLKSKRGRHYLPFYAEARFSPPVHAFETADITMEAEILGNCQATAAMIEQAIESNEDPLEVVELGERILSDGFDLARAIASVTPRSTTLGLPVIR